MKQTFFDLDGLVGKEEYGTDTGCTSCVVFLNDSYIWTVNAGDSRAVLSREDGI